jgi:hypothetical protein
MPVAATAAQMMITLSQSPRIAGKFFLARTDTGAAGCTRVAQPLCQRVRQQLRVRMGDDLQASGPDLMAHRRRAGWVCRRGSNNIARRNRAHRRLGIAGSLSE